MSNDIKHNNQFGDEPINMKKTFTITDILFNGISRNKGTIEYYLLDELGNERKVTAMAQLGFRKKIKNIRALYQREIPLVEALTDAEIDQTITIDFTGFNKNPREHKKLTRPGLSGANAYQQNFNAIVPDVSRVPVLAASVVFGTVIVFLLGVFL